jgi:DnaJ-class molecular chaperone
MGRVCPTCGGKGTVFDRVLRMNRPCVACNGSGSGLRKIG